MDICNESSRDKNKSVLNRAAVWATLATGSTHTHTTEFLSVLDIPPISTYMFYNIQRELSQVWQDCLWSVMEEAGKEEYEAAVERGDVDSCDDQTFFCS